MTERASDTPQIGIFGGSFNPPHVAHLIVAEVVREQFDLDRILWIPNRQSPFKEEHDLAPAKDRLEMTLLAIAGSDAFAASDLEVRRSGLSYTVDTIRALQDEDPGAEYHLILGSDSLSGFADWHEPEEIVRRVRLIVFQRPGSQSEAPPGEFGPDVRFANAPLLELSSTDIRNRRNEGRSIRYMVPEPVYDYILERGLYRE